jgi:hypothetical protein
MKKVLAVCALSALLAQPVAVFAQTTTPNPTTPPVTTAPTPGQPGAPGAFHKGEEHHPEIHRAIKRLEAAKEDLQKASHDYDGHREQAVKLIDQAEEQLQMALKDVR